MRQAVPQKLPPNNVQTPQQDSLHVLASKFTLPLYYTLYTGSQLIEEFVFKFS